MCACVHECVRGYDCIKLPLFLVLPNFSHAGVELLHSIKQVVPVVRLDIFPTELAKCIFGSIKTRHMISFLKFKQL